MSIHFTLAKCKTRAGYSAKLEKPAKLNLNAIKKSCEVILSTPLLLVIREQGVEVIVHGYGELLFKECSDVILMRKIAEKVYQAGLE